MVDLSKIKKHRLNVQLLACKNMLLYYKEDRRDSGDCPLCEAAGSRSGRQYVCESCPWKWFEQIECVYYCISKFGISTDKLRVGTDKKSLKARKARIRMLKRWISAIEKELETR